MKLIFTILLFSFLKSEAQDTAYWTGWGHLSYQVQQGKDSLNWQTIGTVGGQIDSADYTYLITSTNYYYRVKADNDSTQAILVSGVLSVKTPPAHGKTKKRIAALRVKVSVTDRIHYIIESPQPQQMQYSLYNVVGQKLTYRLINLYEGTNEIYDAKPAVTGIYYGQFIGNFDFITAKIINE